jgi:hypothetical protein
VDEPTINVDLNGNGNTTDTQLPTLVFVLQPNGTGNQLGELPSEYPPAP